MFKEADLVVIGTGPGGLSAAKAAGLVLHPEARIQIVEGGEGTEQRQCVALHHGKECKACGGKCQVIQGIGGACSAVSCGMLSEHPAGSGLERLWTQAKLLEIERKVLGWVEEVNGQPLRRVEPNLDPRILKGAEENGMQLKTYTSSEVDGATFEKLMLAIFRDVVSREQTNVRFGERVVGITPTSDKWVLLTNKGNRVETSKVIIAAGRAGNGMMMAILNQLGVKLKGVGGYIGLRYEDVRDERLVALRQQVLDPKFIRDGWRMFCFCPEGKVVGMSVPSAVAGKPIDSLEGCVWPDSPYGNFSIQQERNYGDWQSYMEWRKEFVAQYLQLSGGGLIAQSLLSLVDRTEPMSFDSSIPTRWKPGCVEALMGRDQVDSVVEFLLDFEKVMGSNLITPNAGIFAPETHMWPKFETDPNMQTSLPGIYVVGDMHGAARGILQAMNMGYVAGRAVAQ